MTLLMMLTCVCLGGVIVLDMPPASNPDSQHFIVIKSEKLNASLV